MKYRKHSTRNKAFVQYQKKVIYLPGKYNSPESRAAYHKLVSELNPQAKKIITLDDLCVHFLDFAVKYYNNQAEYRNFRTVCRKLLRHFGGTPVVDFGPVKLREFRNQVLEGNSRKYANAVADKVKRMFKWAVSNELIPAHNYHALASLSPLKMGEGREIDPVKPAAWKDVRLVIRAAPPMLAAMMRVQWLIGCRPGEIMSMHVDDIHKERGVWVWSPSKHKNKWRGKSLSYYIGPLGQKYLEPWMDGAIEGYVFSPRRVRACANLVYCVYGYRQAIKRVCERIGVKPIAPHRIRHSKATSLRKIMGVEAARIALGLSSINTAAIYAEANEKAARRIAKRF
jgi:integrase